ncbi:uncharacterized protein NECHADRAFT_89306 [Fusarium vanettenii 77-13-4]|uniref:Zn(2)-C6 fungal-type domain-containing protein n=1 Tax=Fusarium vanettenii (strain ATCC MYA-4622 / CBS 123669 / FGSC 9596 / NRRL 45880 / 77-13-4) TaxID=660122 RepID=C7ZQT4_FUSV7|nr:uncharacterized protein NECHADRAFT_89306 [Fusarium vanettenii 77-13-4]EEU33631.1 hypothetical protein NECHADRAFT_89306 [Fusarium vanettenii 77-13-4]
MNPLKRDNTGETRAGEQQKCAAACAGCRTRKIRCNGGIPCPNCADRSLDCYYPEAQRRGPRTSKNTSKPDSDLASDSSSRSKSARTSSNSTANQRTSGPATAIRSSATSSTEGHKPVAEGSSYESLITFLEPGTPQPVATREPQPAAVPISDATAQGDPDPPDSTKLTDCDTSATPDCAEDLVEGVVGCEYHGPGAMISICSKSAVTWRISARFASDISRRLKLDRGLLSKTEPEPSKQLAWAYCNAFFSGQSQIWFKMVHQATFEARLASDLAGDNTERRDDPSWYALRNIVYAVGCRTLDSKLSSPDLQEASQQSMRYFCNALSMHTELLYSRTGLYAVQALALMVWPISPLPPTLPVRKMAGTDQGLLVRRTRVPLLKGLPALHSTLCSVPTRYGWPNPKDYTEDRRLSLRQIVISNETWGQHATATGMIKHARILSSVIRTLNVIRSSSSMSEETFAMVQRLDSRLQDWRNSLPRFIQFGMLPGAGLPKGVTSEQCLLLEYSYYTTLIQIHSIIMAPWSKVYQEKPTTNPSHQAHILKSASIVAEASRKIISQLRYITVSPDTPKWSGSPPTRGIYPFASHDMVLIRWIYRAVLVYPMIALVHLFIFILEYPTSASVDADISLMHEAAAHFNFLEYRTGTISLPFARDLANLEVFGLDVWDTTDWDAFIPWDNVLQDLGNGF